MASRKKQSDAIALLLSNYNDEEEDEDMEDVEQQNDIEEELEGDEERQERREYDDYGELRRGSGDAAMADVDGTVAGESGNDDGAPPNAGDNEAPSDGLNRRRRRGAFTIVDYGRDEVAMSPETEEGEIEGSRRVPGDFHDKTPPGTVRTPQLSEPSNSDTMNETVLESEGRDAAEAVAEEQKDIDPLDKFLPPPLKAKCSEELQRKINKFLEYKRAGKSFNAEVRNKKDYRNPNFLVHAVRYQDIDQIGSCFSKDVFDPHGYDKSDYCDEIEADMRREMERKEQERKRSQKVEYVSGGTQPGIVGAAPKINVPFPGVSTMAATGLNSLPPAADAIPREGRQNKKSKWDKVDGDRKNPLPSGLQDSMSTVGTHASLLSSASAGAGYMAFAQQRRREVEEKRSSERKLDRRS
ncbi:uncharacterized protein [Pyrus communis]|uniref:uncharacterized protein isoform X1 n=2 Tax=Pyrus communis TaxID=23211 RepID=UPI0035C068CE